LKRIPLTQGKFALVDDANFEAVNQFNWYAFKNRRGWYASRTITVSPGHRKNLYLHQVILPGIPQIDHRDGDGLNCQRHNLRPATHTQNQWGFKRKRVGASSRFRGVNWKARNRKWQARIRVNQQLFYLGLFDSEIKAAIVYDVAAKKFFGDFASPNFP